MPSILDALATSNLGKTLRYFGHRIDSVQKWEPLSWQGFHQTELLMKQSREELNNIVAYFTDSSDHYKDFRDLHIARNNAATIYNDKNHSLSDKQAAYERFLRDIEALAWRAKSRLSNCKIYFSQQNSADTIFKLSDYISGGTAIAKRDSDLVVTLLQRGN
jgi:hypothetical protein